MAIVITGVLILIIIFLGLYIRHLRKVLEKHKNINEKINSLTVLQNFMEIAGEEETVDAKIKKINEIIIEKYEIKYSTIVVFDGAEYIIKASNVDSKHYDVLTELHNEEIFKESVETSTPKYVTIENENEKLPYQKIEMGRAKSAMFFPLYIDNIYIGYWIMESGQMHAFDHTDKTMLEVVKNNIISVLRTVAYQEAIETIGRTDKFTELHSAEYLYGKAKMIIDKYATSAVCMFRITNIEEINEKMSRQIGNEIITEISNIIKEKMSNEYIFVRYMGPKFAIVFSGVEEDSLEDFLKNIKEEIEELQVVDEEYDFEDDEEDEEKEVISPKLNFVISTYYKGTGLEKLTKKLEEYIDTAPKDENQINYI